MPTQHNAHSLRIGLFAVTALISGLIGNADPGWAKHNKMKTQSTGSSDPCADPTAFVKNKIAKIRDLQKTVDSGAANSISAWISQLENTKKGVDQDKVAQISELRRDADSVNDMLRAGGCPTIDIDQELAKPGT